MSKLLGGKELAAQLQQESLVAAKNLKTPGTIPKLAVVIATDDDSVHSYVNVISRTATDTGVEVQIIKLEAESGSAEIAKTLNQLASDDSIHGIILQTPLAETVDLDYLRSLIPPEKDVDGANPLSAGRLVCGIKAFAPSTAAAVVSLLKYHKINLEGAHVVVVGRSLVVGKPVAHLLLAADATVTICHSKTRRLENITSQADILVVAAGQPKMIGARHVKPGVVIIDVGTNFDPNGQVVGDVDATAVVDTASGLSPVPGGIGPVTTAILLNHTISAAKTDIYP